MGLERQQVGRELVEWIRSQRRDHRGRIAVYEHATGKDKFVLPVDAHEGFSMGLYAIEAPATKQRQPKAFEVQ